MSAPAELAHVGAPEIDQQLVDLQFGEIAAGIGTGMLRGAEVSVGGVSEADLLAAATQPYTTEREIIIGVAPSIQVTAFGSGT